MQQVAIRSPGDGLPIERGHAEVVAASLELGEQRLRGRSGNERVTIELATQFHPIPFAGVDLGCEVGDSRGEGVHCRRRGGPGIDGGLGQIGHNVNGAASGNGAHVNEEVGNRGRQPVDGQTELGQGENGVTSSAGITPRMGGPTVQGGLEYAGGRTRLDHVAGFAGGFKDEGEVMRIGHGFDQRSRGFGANFFVGSQQNRPSNLGGVWRLLKRGQGSEHGHYAAFHVGDARTVEAVWTDQMWSLEGMISAEDGVIVSAADDANGSFEAKAGAQCYPTIGVEGDAFDVRREFAECGFQRVGHAGQPREMGGSGVDQAPRHEALDECQTTGGKFENGGRDC